MTSNKKPSSFKNIAIAVVLLASAGYWFFREERRPERDAGFAERPEETGEKPAASAIPKPPRNALTAERLAPDPPESGSKKSGRQDSARSEKSEEPDADDDSFPDEVNGLEPHDIPPELLSFAEELATRMELAVQSPSAADEVYGELEECVQGSGELTVRAMCLINAGRLAELYPERLGSDFGRLVEEVPDELKELME